MRALRQEWPIPEYLREILLVRMCEIAANEPGPGQARGPHKPREQIAAFRALLAAGRLTLSQSDHDLKAEPPDQLTVRDVMLDEAEQRALDYKPELPPEGSGA